MNSKSYKLNILAILSINMTNACGTLENAALQTMMETWPNLSSTTIRLLVTLPGLVSMLVMSVIGLWVGKKIKFKTCIFLGVFLILFGGLVPFFIHTNWYFILACRILLGLGIGLLSIRSSLLILSANAVSLARYIGWGAALGSITSALLSPIVGWLTNLGWYYPFLVNAIGLVTAILVLLFLKEPEVKKQNTQKTKEKVKIPSIMYVFLGNHLLLTMTLYPLLSGLSTYLSEIQLGDASMAGWMLSFYTVAGILSNLLLKQFQTIFKDKFLPFLLVLPVLGLGLVLFSGNVVLITLGIFLSGMGYITYMSSVQLYAGIFCDEQTIIKVSPLLLGMIQLGIFLSSYYIDISSQIGWLNTPMQNPYFICLMVYLVVSILAFIFKKQLYPYNKEA